MRIKNMQKKHVAIISGSVIAVISGLAAHLSMNTQFDLFMPDNAALYNVTLSSDNFSLLKQNVGIFSLPAACYDPKCDKRILSHSRIHS